MSYVKNCSPGKITMDLPKANYIYELPLLSVGDIHGAVNVSLIFNREMAENNLNPYFIQPGYKLNLQKMIIFSGDSPVCVQDAMGNRVNVNTQSWPYTFEDESQRILRQNNNTARPYVIEYPDRSLEYYNSSGMIVLVVDKYGEEVLEFTYTSGQLRTITYRDNKYIRLTYDTTTKTLKTLSYDNNNFVTNFAYPIDAITVTHYSGVTYNVNHGDYTNFVASTTITENSSTVTYKTELSEAERTITISDYVGSSQIDTTSYTFPSAFTSETVKNGNKYMEVEIVDKNDVETRAQYYDGKLLYSYELTDGDANISNNQYLGTVQIYNTVDDLKSSQAVGAKTINNGCEFSEDPPAVERWKCDVNRWFGGDIKGYYLLTGWMKAKSSATTFGHTKLYISNDSTASGLEFYPCILVDDKWKFFAYKFYMDASFIAVGTVFKEKVEIKGLKIEPQYNQIQSANDKSRAMVSEEVLIHTDNGDETIIPIRGSAFTCGNETIICREFHETIDQYGNNDYVTFEDLFRYKVNQLKETNTAEFYSNRGRKVIVSSSAGSATVTHDGMTYYLSNCKLGRRTFTGLGTVTTRVLEDDDRGFLVYETVDTNGTDTLTCQILNEYLDVVQKIEYDHSEEQVKTVTTTYTRDRDLVTGEAVTGLYARNTAYDTDSSGNTTVTKTDEYGKKTIYTLDPVWGVVISVKLPNGDLVTDTYDDDMCTLTKRTFGSATGRFNSLIYSNGNLSSLQTGGLDYDFTYSGDKLTSVKKNNAHVEAHTHNGNSETRSYYPQQSGALHSTISHFDNYGRLTKIDGILTNTYDLFPSFNSNGVLDGSANNGSALLAMTVDEIAGQTARYDYNSREQLVRKTVTSKTNFATKISNEDFTYDNKNRLTSRSTTYTGSGFDPINETIEYRQNPESIADDNEVSTYTYSLGTSVKAKTKNTTDDFHRLTQKKITVGTKVFTKTFEYVNTRLNKIIDSTGDTTTLTYDDCGRLYRMSAPGNMVTYHYDQYGQLIREDNQGLAKTYVYEYNDIGNVTKVKAYNYTLNNTPSGTPTTTTFGYNTTYPDRLTSFGGSSIAYNAMGCPTSYDGMAAGWNKGKLSTLSSGTFAAGTTNYTYTYNGLGQRSAKSYTYTEGTSGITSVQTGDVTAYSKKYYYDHAGRLMGETSVKTRHNAADLTERISFLYDERGMVGMRRTEGSTSKLYYYQRNLLGDVTALYDTSGNMVAKYLYDAWGNCTVSTETTNYTVANANPIRYRGYYYDDDTGLYYCNARYYSPLWRRFISPDDTAYLDPETVNGLNLYCYCNNDPVNLIDPSGHDPEWWQWLVSGIEVAAGIVLCFVPGAQGYGATLIGMGAGSMISGYFTEANGGTFSSGWLGGQIAGALSAIPGIGISLGVSAGSVVTDWVNGGWDDISLSKALWSGVIAYGLNYGPIMIGAVAGYFKTQNTLITLANAYNAIWTGAASSIVNAYWKE